MTNLSLCRSTGESVDFLRAQLRVWLELTLRSNATAPTLMTYTHGFRVREMVLAQDDLEAEMIMKLKAVDPELRTTAALPPAPAPSRELALNPPDSSLPPLDNAAAAATADAAAAATTADSAAQNTAAAATNTEASKKVSGAAADVPNRTDDKAQSNSGASAAGKSV